MSTVVVNGVEVRCVLDNDDVASTSRRPANVVDDSIASGKNVERSSEVNSVVHFAHLARDGVPTRSVGGGDGASGSRM